MAFLLALTSRKESGSLRIDHIQKIRLGGTDGPIARHVLALPDDVREWDLGVAQLACDLRPPDWPAERNPVLLWDSGSTPFLPMLVTRICGVSDDFDTELIVHLEILASDGDTFQPISRLTSEALRLTGGKLTPKAKWWWAPPKMAIGSAVVG